MASGSSIAVVKGLGSGNSVRSITDRTSTSNPQPKGVFIGGGGDYEFYMNGSWVAFKNCNAGSFLPIRPTGVRTDSSTNITAGDVLFLD